eukprot:2949266-Rhodomonas_salina.1
MNCIDAGSLSRTQSKKGFLPGCGAVTISPDLACSTSACCSSASSLSCPIQAHRSSSQQNPHSARG